MLDRLVSFLVDREPVASATGLAGVVTAALGVVSALGVDLDAELVAAIGVLVTALAGWLARKRAWSPVSHAEAVAAGSLPGMTVHEPETATQEEASDA